MQKRRFTKEFEAEAIRLVQTSGRTQRGLVARQKRRFKRTTDSEHSWPVAPNLLGQVFEAEARDFMSLLHLRPTERIIFPCPVAQPDGFTPLPGQFLTEINKHTPAYSL